MNRQDLSELLNGLPDEWIDSAAEPERTQKRRAFRLWVGGIAACLAVLIAAAVYPRLRVQQPERIETTAAVTETTASAPESQTLPSSVSASETTAPLTGTTSSGTTAVFSETQTAVTETVTASTAIVTETESSTDSSAESSETTASTAAAHTSSSPSSTAEARDTTEILSITTAPPETTAAEGSVIHTSENTKQTTASVSSYSHITTAMRTTHEESPQSTQMGNTTLECTTSLAQQQFTVPHWEEAVRRYEITQPENTQAAYSIPIHATVYTEALPELCYFDEKPEIDMTQYDAVLISAEIVSPDACIHDAIITADGRFVLMIYYPVYPKPLPVYNKHSLIAVPKKYQLTPEKIIIGECASVDAAEFDRIKYDPLTILDMKG